MSELTQNAHRPTESEELLRKPEEQNDERAGVDDMTPVRGEDPIDPFKQPIYDPSKRDPERDDPFSTPFNPGPDDPFAPPPPARGDDEELVEIPIPN
jgi:hypothetical protein